VIEPIQSRCAVFRFRPLANDQIAKQITGISDSEGVTLDDDAKEAIINVSQGDLRKAITALQVAASLDKHVTRALIYETTATAPPEQLHDFLLACKRDGFHPARRRLQTILDKFGLAGTDFINQLHRAMYDTEFLEEITGKRSTKAPTKKDMVLENYNKQDSDTRLLAYKILLEKFNNKYSNLQNNQKNYSDKKVFLKINRVITNLKNE
jgi:replication factor C small subunit